MTELHGQSFRVQSEDGGTACITSYRTQQRLRVDLNELDELIDVLEDIRLLLR